MKAVYRLNEEKLGLNHKVLKEKEQVSQTAIKRKKEKEQKFLGTLKKSLRLLQRSTQKKIKL